MPDQYTEVSYTSWGSRVSSSFGGVVVGLALIAGAFYLLNWNETRSLKRIMALKEVLSGVVSVSAEKPDPANTGKPVYITARAAAEGEASDPALGVHAPGLRLRRDVEVYEWRETVSTSRQQQLGGGEITTKTYTYDRGWEKIPVDSRRFHHPEGHENPASLPYQSQTFAAPGIHAGGFTLSNEFVDKIGSFADYPVSAPGPNAQPPLQAVGGAYVSGNPAAPVVGDLHIAFRLAPETEISAIGRQNSKGLEPYPAKDGDSIVLLKTDVLSADALIVAAQRENAAIAWLLRLGGFVLTWLGIWLVVRPLATIASVIPFVGGIAEFGLGFFALTVAAPLSIVVIAVAWLAARPVIAYGLFAAAAALAFALIAHRRKAAPAPAPAI